MMLSLNNSLPGVQKEVIVKKKVETAPQNEPKKTQQQKNLDLEKTHQKKKITSISTTKSCLPLLNPNYLK